MNLIALAPEWGRKDIPRSINTPETGPLVEAAPHGIANLESRQNGRITGRED